MYCIRGLKTEMGKVTFPLGQTATIGTITENTSFTYVKNRTGGNNSDFLFNVHSDINNNGYTPVNANFVSLKVKSAVGNNTYTKTVSLFPRRSNDGTLFPINTTQQFSLIAPNPPFWYEQQRFNAARNSVSYSATNEIMFMQTKLNVNHHGWNKLSAVRVDPKFINDTDVRGTITDVIVEKDPLVNNDDGVTTIGIDSSACRLEVFNKSGIDMELSGRVNSYQILDETAEYFSTLPGRSEDTLYAFDVGILSTVLLANINNIGRFSIVIGGSHKRVSIPLTESLKTILARGATKYTYVCFRFVAFLAKGTFTPRTPRTATPREMLLGTWRHRSDLMTDSISVNPDGEYLTLTFDRPSRVDVFFDDVGLGYNVVSDVNNTIRIDRADKLFTMGGQLRVVQKHDLKFTSENKTWIYNIPDTFPPTAPTADSFTTTTVGGTAYRGDVVYVKRGSVVLGSVTALSTDIWELTLEGFTLAENDELTIWTEDQAGNKSADVIVIVSGVREPVFLDSDFNGDVLSITD